MVRTSTGGMMSDWHDNLVQSANGIQEILRNSRRIAVLGIKTEAQGGQPAFWVPQYLQGAGYEIIPVPVYYADTTEILGQPVHRSLAEVPQPVDLVLVFRRGSDVPPHVDDILAAKPRAAWMQSGIRNDEAARRLAEAGIKVVQDRCAMIEHRQLAWSRR
jgi:uncharacterized protein